MMTMPSRSSLLLALVLALGLLLAPLASADSPVSAADAFLKQLARSNLFSGPVGVATAGEPRLELHKGYGTANYELGVAMQRHHRMTIGSNTKFMTAVSIFQLHQRGLLHVDDLVAKYVNGSDFGKPAGWTWCPKVYNSTSPACEKVTIRHMLTMASGLVRYDNCPYNSSLWQWKYCIDQQPGGKAFGNDVYRPIVAAVTLEEVILKFLDAPLEFVPGTQYAYSNSGWSLAGYIVEKLSGLPIAEYYQKYIFDKAGMKDTYYGPGMSTYGVRKNTADDPGYTSLFAPFGALVSDPAYGPFVSDPRQAVGVGNLPLPPKARAGTFQGIQRAPWYTGELIMGGPAGAVISSVADMIRWFQTFVAAPEKLGLNSTTLADMFSVYNPHSAISQRVADGNKTSITGYFGPGIAVLPGPNGQWNMSQIMYQGDIGAVACRVHVKLRQPASKSTIIVFFSSLQPAIPRPDVNDDLTTDCMVKDPLNPSEPAQKLPQQLCDIMTFPQFTQYIGLKLTQLWKY